jgi:hypothetical protein
MSRRRLLRHPRSGRRNRRRDALSMPYLRVCWGLVGLSGMRAGACTRRARYLPSFGFDCFLLRVFGLFVIPRH